MKLRDTIEPHTQPPESEEGGPEYFYGRVMVALTRVPTSGGTEVSQKSGRRAVLRFKF